MTKKFQRLLSINKESVKDTVLRVSSPDSVMQLETMNVWPDKYTFSRMALFVLLCFCLL